MNGLLSYKVPLDCRLTVELRPGDCINIPAHQKHRVEWTTPDEPTVWLAVFYAKSNRLYMPIRVQLKWHGLGGNNEKRLDKDCKSMEIIA